MDTRHEQTLAENTATEVLALSEHSDTEVFPFSESMKEIAIFSEDTANEAWLPSEERMIAWGFKKEYIQHIKKIRSYAEQEGYAEAKQELGSFLCYIGKVKEGLEWLGQALDLGLPVQKIINKYSHPAPNALPVKSGNAIHDHIASIKTMAEQGSPEAMEQYGLLLVEAGKLQEAQQWLKQALACGMPVTEALENISRLAAVVENYSESTANLMYYQQKEKTPFAEASLHLHHHRYAQAFEGFYSLTQDKNNLPAAMAAKRELEKCHTWTSLGNTVDWYNQLAGKYRRDNNRQAFEVLNACLTPKNILQSELYLTTIISWHSWMFSEDKKHPKKMAALFSATGTMLWDNFLQDLLTQEPKTLLPLAKSLFEKFEGIETVGNYVAKMSLYLYWLHLVKDRNLHIEGLSPVKKYPAACEKLQQLATQIANQPALKVDIKPIIDALIPSTEQPFRLFTRKPAVNSGNPQSGPSLRG